eukprot:353564_1
MSHRIPILNLICYQFSCTGTVVLDQILMSSVVDQESFRSSQIDHAIQTGLGIVAKDKYNRVASFVFVFDYCDPAPRDKDNKFTPKAEKRAYLIDKVTNSSKQRVNLVRRGVQYGQMIYF